METKDVLMSFQSKLKPLQSERIPRPQLTGHLAKFLATNEVSTVESKKHTTQHFRSSCDKSVQPVHESNQLALSSRVVNFCHKCTCDDCQTQKVSLGNDHFDNTYLSLVNMHEMYLQELRQQFQKSLLENMKTWQEYSNQLSSSVLDQTIQRNNFLRSGGEETNNGCEKIPFLHKMHLEQTSSGGHLDSSVKIVAKGGNDISLCKDHSTDEGSPETKSELKKPIDEGSTLSSKSSQSVEDESYSEPTSRRSDKEQGHWISFGSGNVCRPLRKSSSLKRQEPHWEVRECVVKLEDVMNFKPYKTTKIFQTLETKVKSGTGVQQCEPPHEGDSFLQDLSLSLVSKEPAAVKPTKISKKPPPCRETCQTRSGRAIKPPKQYWMSKFPSNETKEQKLNRTQKKDSTDEKKCSENAEMISSSVITDCQTIQVLLKQGLKKRQNSVAKISVEKKETNYPLPKKRKVTKGPLKPDPVKKIESIPERGKEGQVKKMGGSLQINRLQSSNHIKEKKQVSAKEKRGYDESNSCFVPRRLQKNVEPKRVQGPRLQQEYSSTPQIKFISYFDK